MGMERLAPTFEDVNVLITMLARSAVGARLTGYNTWITWPRQAGEADGPEQCHLVIVDNGRSAVLGSAFREILRCIRCGACMNTYLSVLPRNRRPRLRLNLPGSPRGGALAADGRLQGSQGSALCMHAVLGLRLGLPGFDSPVQAHSQAPPQRGRTEPAPGRRKALDRRLWVRQRASGPVEPHDEDRGQGFGPDEKRPRSDRARRHIQVDRNARSARRRRRELSCRPRQKRQGHPQGSVRKGNGHDQQSRHFPGQPRSGLRPPAPDSPRSGARAREQLRQDAFCPSVGRRIGGHVHRGRARHARRDHPHRAQHRPGHRDRPRAGLGRPGAALGAPHARRNGHRRGRASGL